MTTRAVRSLTSRRLLPYLMTPLQGRHLIPSAPLPMYIRPFHRPATCTRSTSSSSPSSPLHHRSHFSAVRPSTPSIFIPSLLNRAGSVLSRPPILVLQPVRWAHPPQQQQAAGGRGDNQALFQLVVVGLRMVARALPFLWRSGRVQQLYRRYPKSVLVLLVIPAMLTAAFLVSHASFTPYSNRLHFTFLGPATELNLGNAAYSEVVQTERERLLSPSDPTVQQVKEVAGNILRVAVEDGVVDPKAMKDWKVNVIESNVQNAFVLPNGGIFVYTGILPICKTEAGLATVLGHEVTHALAHHAVEKMGFVSLLLIAYDFTRGVIDSNNPQGGLASTATNFLLTTLAQMILPLAHSRKMETEADQVGLMLMAKAGYDPRAGVDVWARMTAEEEKRRAKGAGAGAMPEFLSSHPASSRRVERMREWGAERQADYERAVERARREGRKVPQGQRPLVYRPTRSAAAIERMDRERASAETGFAASALAVGPFKGVLNLGIDRGD